MNSVLLALLKAVITDMTPLINQELTTLEASIPNSKIKAIVTAILTAVENAVISEI